MEFKRTGVSCHSPDAIQRTSPRWVSTREDCATRRIFRQPLVVVMRTLKPNSGLGPRSKGFGGIPGKLTSSRRPISRLGRGHDYVPSDLSGYRAVAMALCDGLRRSIRDGVQQAGVARFDFVTQWRSLAVSDGRMARRRRPRAPARR